MALNPDDLKNDILADTAIMGVIPGVAVPQLTIFFERLSVHITNQIKRGVVTTVTIDGSGVQNNSAPVE